MAVSGTAPQLKISELRHEKKRHRLSSSPSSTPLQHLQSRLYHYIDQFGLYLLSQIEEKLLHIFHEPPKRTNKSTATSIISTSKHSVHNIIIIMSGFSNPFSSGSSPAAPQSSADIKNAVIRQIQQESNLSNARALIQVSHHPSKPPFTSPSSSTYP